MKEEIKKEIEALGTYLTLDDEGNSYLTYATRENGNVGDAEYGEDDMDEAYRVLEYLESIFDEDIDIQVDTFDEWVILQIEF